MAGTLIEYVRRLEGRDNRTRGDEVLGTLAALGLKPVLQERRWISILRGGRK